MRMLTLALGLAIATPSVAATGASLRLEQELGRLSQRQAWSGVERTFRELEKTGETPSADALLLGAEAARFLGNAAGWQSRLVRAQKAGADVQEQLDRISENFGAVHIHGPLTRTSVLVPETMPFSPDLRRAIVYAQERVATTRDFTGLLPVGKYAINDKVFLVVKGSAAQDLAIPKQKGGDALLTWNGPTVSAGAVYGTSVAPTEALDDVAGGLQAQAETFRGVGPAIELGWTTGFTRRTGVFLAVGYQGMPSGSTAQSARPASQHSVSGALGLAVRAGPLMVQAGPSWRMVGSHGTGVHEPFELDPQGTWDDDNVRWANDSIEWRGLSLAPGVRLGTDLAVANTGSMAWVIGLRGGVATDGARTFAEGGLQVGFAPSMTVR